MLGSGEPYQFEPPVLEEESYASNDSFDGLKRERTYDSFPLSMVAMKATIYH